MNSRKLLSVLMGVLLIALLASCSDADSPTYKYTLIYEIHYPDGAKTRMYEFVSDNDVCETQMEVDRATTFLYVKLNWYKWELVAKSTAPMEVISFYKHKVTKRL